MLHAIPYGKITSCRTVFIQDSCKRHQHEGFSIIWNSRNSCKASEPGEEAGVFHWDAYIITPCSVHEDAFWIIFIWRSLPTISLHSPFIIPRRFSHSKTLLTKSSFYCVFLFVCGFYCCSLFGFFLCTCWCSNQQLKQQCKIQICSPNTVTWTWTASVGSN